MAQKKLSGVLKMYVGAGKAAPSPPLGPALGQVSDFWNLFSINYFETTIFYPVFAMRYTYVYK